MELSQPRPCGAQGAKPTHDFLSLYSPAQQDPTPGIAGGGYLRTHDFLQPLEQVEKNVAKEGIEKSFLPCPPSMVEHVLPGGMGTYSISYINQSQKVPKPEGIVTSAAQSSSSNNNDENNSNCSSYTGSGFTLWEESNVNKGKTGKENIAGARHVMRDGGMKIGVPWTTSMERPSQSSSIHNHPSTTFTSLSSSHPSSASKNQYFLDMVKSARSVQEEEYNDEEFLIKKEPSFHHKGGISVKVDTTNPDQKPNSPRSKHSATEQRRRSKINDRFSMLRGIIPHGDQKRDKASFLLEVIEYIQFLQEKVHKYEDSYQGLGWTNDPPNMTPLNDRPTKAFIDQPQLPNSTSGPAFVFPANSNANNSNVPTNRQNPLDCNMRSLDAIKETSQHPQLTNKPSPLCGPDTASQPQPHSRSSTNDCTAAGDKLKDDDRIIESGTISISTIYSQGLCSALTQALRRSGVDLSQANISVQIDLGKRSSSNTSSISPSNPNPNPNPNLKEIGTPSIDQSLAHWQEESSEAAYKRLKTKA